MHERIAELANEKKIDAYVVGWTAGLGFEYCLWGGMFMRGEWEYTKFTPIKDTPSIETIRGEYLRSDTVAITTVTDKDLIAQWEAAGVGSNRMHAKLDIEVSEKEQTKRLTDRIDDPRKIWKLSPMDLKSYSRWYDYSRARDDMFAATDTGFAPWYVVRSDDKKKARLNVIRHLLSQIPYKKPKRDKIELPDRQKRKGYREPAYPYKYVDEHY